MLTSNNELNERRSMMPKKRMKFKDLKPSTSIVVDKDNNILFISNDKEEARERMASYLKTTRVGSSATVKRIDYEKFSDEDTKKKIERWFKMNEETNMTFSSTSPLYGKEDLVLAANSILEATNKNRENILAFLYVNGATNVSVIAGTLDMDERQVESMVKQLERDRLVVSTNGEVSLTKDGKKAAQKANPTLKSVKSESVELDEADAESDAIALTYMVGNETSEDITKPDLKRMAESNRRFDSFEPALKMAIQKGWLQEKGGWVSITDKGRKLNSMMDS